MVGRHAALVECARRMPAVNRLARAAVRRACTFTFRQAGSGDPTPVEPGGVPPQGGLVQAGPLGAKVCFSPLAGQSLMRLGSRQRLFTFVDRMPVHLVYEVAPRLLFN